MILTLEEQINTMLNQKFIKRETTNVIKSIANLEIAYKRDFEQFEIADQINELVDNNESWMVITRDGKPGDIIVVPSEFITDDKTETIIFTGDAKTTTEELAQEMIRNLFTDIMTAVEKGELL